MKQFVPSWKLTTEKVTVSEFPQRTNEGGSVKSFLPNSMEAESRSGTGINTLGYLQCCIPCVHILENRGSMEGWALLQAKVTSLLRLLHINLVKVLMTVVLEACAFPVFHVFIGNKMH
ncbi:uncharacterized protein LOC127239188 [Andrographis paniculata]|uniref:uncharacterized protein LOC127239188 n=1 Tax=Andrographis paniculata TaxID=175694 RepID=UPI0021E831ED|nr:uncharacterized protein LOC127239188 [Andrographis paniculata]